MDASEVEAALARCREAIARRDLEGAEREASSLCSAAPDDSRGWFVAGVIAAERGDFAEAKRRMARSFALASSQAAVNHSIYANVLLDSGDLPGAEREARSALALDPGHHRARAIASTLVWRRARELGATGHLLDAIDGYRESLAMDDSEADKWNDLGNALANAAMLAEAHDAYREALKRDPSYHQVESNLLVNLHYDPSIGPEAMFAAHRAWAAHHAAGIRANPPARRAIAANDRIRVGFLSPALRAGPTGAYLAALLENLDRERFETYCYRTAGSEDATTTRLRRASHAWRDCLDDDDEALDARIRADRLDVLVDLAGHTPGGRLLVLARKPAPVIATWLDYFDTTGLDAVDYLIGDAISTPRDGPQKFSEKVLRLDPCRFCYSPPDYAPEVEDAPAVRNGYIAFGSFNRLSKLAPPVIALWSKVLLSVPGSRLVLKNGAFADRRLGERIAGLFESRGIEGSRIELRGASAHAAMLAEYGDIDIALDPFPFNGGLTTCEALWMGVPVLTLSGETMIARQGQSLLHAARVDEWACHDEEAFVRKALEASRDLPKLSEERRAARGKLAGSPLLAAAAFGSRFGETLESMAGPAQA